MKEKVTHIKRICANNVVRSSHNNQDNELGFFDAVKIAIAAFALIGSIFGIGQICRLRAEGAAFEAAHPELLAEVAKLSPTSSTRMTDGTSALRLIPVPMRSARSSRLPTVVAPSPS